MVILLTKQQAMIILKDQLFLHPKGFSPATQLPER